MGVVGEMVLGVGVVGEIRLLEGVVGVDTVGGVHLEEAHSRVRRGG